MPSATTFVCPSLTLFYLIFMLSTIHAQWYIIKKDYPSNLMNYPNPGKRSLPEQNIDNTDIDCSIPYSRLPSYQAKAAWLLWCRQEKSTRMTQIDDFILPNSNSDEYETVSTPTLIFHERRTPRSVPPYFNEQPTLFNSRLMKILRQTYVNKKKK